ncbi:MAG: peptidoglycan DD-metalloendopeptidase family protein [Bacillota bacterium]|nr:peptidoglycan DD-metalloendopeptidase family protein [Bacillota bacterium]
MKQKRTQHRLGDFMEGKGFYIVLFLCVAAIGISGYYLFNGLTEAGGFGSDPAAVVSGQAELEKKEPTDQPNQTGQTGQKTPTGQDKDKDQEQKQPVEDAAKTQEPAKQEEKPAPKQETTPNEGAAASTAYVWPVQGDVARDFSLEVFAYDETMGDWRTHNGLDIAAELGAPVAACGAGTVSDVTRDPMLGMTVTVDHGRGMESRYANLAESVNVQVGDTVAAGTVLGTVGTTAISESASPSHLHFEMIEYDVSIDPLNYLH